MNFSREELLKLRKLLAVTAEEEIDCTEFMHRVAGYVERVQAGEIVPPGFEHVVQHLQICPECEEEYHALCQSLREVAE